MKVLSAQQMRELDRLTLQAEAISSLDLMERASRAVADELERRWDAMHRFIIFAGPGNNGGDALAVARMLSDDGYMVHAYLLNVRDTLSDDCATNRDRLLQSTNSLLKFETVQRGFDFPTLDADDIIVDGLFGTGLSRPLDGGFAALVRAINASHCTVVAIDSPSGLMSESNAYNDMRSVVRATLTLTMHRPKPSQMLAENEPFVGSLVVLPIGLSERAERDIATPYNITEAADLRPLLRPRPRFAHKGTMGHALLIAGSQGMAGAAILAAKACMRGGVGKVTVATASAVVLPLQVSVPEAIVRISTNHTTDADTNTYQAVGIGPGIGTNEVNPLMLHLMRTGGTPMVFDADALNIIGSHRDWLNRIPTGSILTPHPAELERIVGNCNDDWQRLQRARELAQTYRLHVLLKGRNSAVILPTGQVWFNPTGNPGMATAGSGDVLTGLITSLLAQGYPAADALRLAVYLHGLAGDLALKTVGSEEALIASDIIAHLGLAFHNLSLKLE